MNDLVGIFKHVIEKRNWMRTRYGRHGRRRRMEPLKSEPARRVYRCAQECPFAKLAKEVSTQKKIPGECPFANAASPSNDTEVPVKNHGRCPWPFVLAHNPVAALQDWQTWALLGLILCCVWSKLQ